MAFVPLHNHSDYSLLDGASQLPQMVERAKELGMPALALTDHGVMYGAVELLKLCKGAGIKPIIGNEMYVVNGSIDDPQQKKERRYHLVVLAKNATGYRNLVKLTSISHLRGMRGRGIFSRACIDKHLLQQYSEGLIVATACLGGEIPQAIMRGRPEVARDVARWYQEVFGDDFYLEIQDHGSLEDRIVNVEIVKIAKELGIGLIATNDAHYLTRNDVEAHDALLCVLTGKLISDEKRLRYTGTEFIRSEEEMGQLFADHLDPAVVQEAIATTALVADKVEDYDILGRYQMPRFPIPEGHTPVSYLKEVTEQGLRDRLSLAPEAPIEAEYGERLTYELGIMEQMGFPTYFLVVWDYIRFAREQGIPVGPGRGSAAGSLVAYALGITNIDPVSNGLLFERFLNPERKSMPDIDTDFCIERRGEVIDYVTRRYGDDKVAQIITFNRMTSKAVLKDVARVLDIPYGDADRLAKLIPVARGKPAKLAAMISEESPNPDFREKYLSDPVVKRWVDMAMRIEGTNKTFGVHAAGVVIAADPLDELVPLQRNNDGQVITQYFMEDVESMGLLKMDFLGLKNLTMIDKTLELVASNFGERIDPDKLPPQDEETFALLARGDLEGIFQLESSGMRQIVRDLRPSSLEDISSILALYRPGPLDAGLIPKFINRKHGREAIDFAHQALEPILNETYGIMVYQEQIMKIAQDLAGYSLGEADLLRRAMGKKKVSEMQKHRGIFVKGASERGVDDKVADELFDQMVLFAEYCFNKSHSTAYGAVTYQTAYLKAHHPVEYMAALLTSVKDKLDKAAVYLADCRAAGIPVLTPDINRAEVDFTALPVDQIPPGLEVPHGCPGVIVFGLSAVRNVGVGLMEQLLEERRENGPYESFHDFAERAPEPVLHRRTVESLIRAGAFDGFGHPRLGLLAVFEQIIDSTLTRRRERSQGVMSLFGDWGGGDDAVDTGFDEKVEIPDREFDKPERLRVEKEMLGLYVSDHPLRGAEGALRRRVERSITDLESMDDGSIVVVGGVVTTLARKYTRAGDQMASFVLEDLAASIEVTVFPRTLAAQGHKLQDDVIVAVKGRLDRRDESRFGLIATEITALDGLSDGPAALLTVRLGSNHLDDGGVDRLREIISEHPGRTPVEIEIPQGQTVRLPDGYRVDVDRVIGEIRVAFGHDAVRL